MRRHSVKKINTVSDLDHLVIFEVHSALLKETNARTANTLLLSHSPSLLCPIPFLQGSFRTFLHLSTPVAIFHIVVSTNSTNSYCVWVYEPGVLLDPGDNTHSPAQRHLSSHRLVEGQILSTCSIPCGHVISMLNPHFPISPSQRH